MLDFLKSEKKGIWASGILFFELVVHAFVFVSKTIVLCVFLNSRVCTKAPYQTKKSSEDSSHGEIPLSPSHSSTPPVDGCKQLHNEFMTRSEEKVSCLVKDQHEQLWPVKVEKNEIKERQLQLT